MNYNVSTSISASYRKDEFNDLRLSMRSGEREWGVAIEIFEDRIRGRYLNIMDRIMSKVSWVVDGIFVMALNCLLIETLL